MTDPFDIDAARSDIGRDELELSSGKLIKMTTTRKEITQKFQTLDLC